MLSLRSNSVVVVFLLSGFAIADEPNPVIEDLLVDHFIESQRTERNGPGKILASVYSDYDEDSHPDRLVVYTYEHGPNRGDKAYKIFVAGFLTERLEATDVLVIDESEMVSEAFRGYSFDGSALVIRGDKRLPGDNMCCPSAIASITLSIVDHRVVILNSEYRERSEGE